MARALIYKRDLDTEYRRTAPELLDMADAARYLGVSERVLLSACKHQGLPSRLIGGRVRVFSRRAIDAWVAEGFDAVSDDDN